MERLKNLKKQYEEFKAQDLKLDMSRGKPSKQQLDLTLPMQEVLKADSDYTLSNGMDARNYGGLVGIMECRKLMADLLEVQPENTLLGGNSSLQLMFDTISHAYTHGVCGNTPWCKQKKKVKFICVVPGYDRHFAITEHFGFNNVCVDMLPDGPDMDAVEKLVENDDSVKGIWCVPKYSNPTGYSYSDETVKRLASLKPAAPDFRIFWDNAYCIHHLYDDTRDTVLEILSECAKAGNPDMVYEFASTSKVSFPGSGVSVIATSENNLDDIKAHMTFQTIGYDKINELRHVRFFENADGVHKHMLRHAYLLRPKFQVVWSILEDELNDLREERAVDWTYPRGGYFISFDAPEGCAKKIVAMCADAGVKLTDAGATYPGGKDPKDSNIRIAPSLPPVEELEIATKLLTLCTKIAYLEKHPEKDVEE